MNLKKNKKVDALRGLVLAGVISACSVGVSQAAVIMSQTGTTTTHSFTEANANTVVEDSFTFTKDSGTTFYNRSGVWSAGTTRTWDGTVSPYIAVFGDAGAMTMTFNSDVSSVLAFVNYLTVTSSMTIHNAAGDELESTPLNGVLTELAGGNLGFSRVEGDIRSITFTNGYVAVRDVSTTAVPEPSSAALLGLGGLLLILRRRK